MENEELDVHSDSSTRPSGKNSASSAKARKPPSKRGAGKVGGEGAESKLTLSDVLLTKLQSLLADLRESGIIVTLYKSEEGIIIKMPGTGACQSHRMIHNGTTCPMC